MYTDNNKIYKLLVDTKYNLSIKIHINTKFISLNIKFDKQKELDKLQKTTIENMWLNELKVLEESL
jgi:hypothetical protein